MIIIIIEFIKNYAYSKSSAILSFYRDSNAKEIDAFVEENGKIYPVEIKRSANSSKREIKKYSVFNGNMHK